MLLKNRSFSCDAMATANRPSPSSCLGLLFKRDEGAGSPYRRREQKGEQRKAKQLIMKRGAAIMGDGGRGHLKARAWVQN
jgi:hypothetical protein